MAEKKAEFVVTDRRRFGTEGEPRPDAQVAEEEKPAKATGSTGHAFAGKTCATNIGTTKPERANAGTAGIARSRAGRGDVAAAHGRRAAPAERGV